MHAYRQLSYRVKDRNSDQKPASINRDPGEINQPRVHEIGILEQTHAFIETALKISTEERCSIWHKYVQKAAINYNTTYHETLCCEPTTVFH